MFHHKPGNPFEPSTIKNYAIDYNNDKYIDLKNSEDAYASAANYLKSIGWDKNSPCFYKIQSIYDFQ